MMMFVFRVDGTEWVSRHPDADKWGYRHQGSQVVQRAAISICDMAYRMATNTLHMKVFNEYAMWLENYRGKYR